MKSSLNLSYDRICLINISEKKVFIKKVFDIKRLYIFLVLIFFILFSKNHKNKKKLSKKLEN